MAKVGSRDKAQQVRTLLEDPCPIPPEPTWRLAIFCKSESLTLYYGLCGHKTHDTWIDMQAKHLCMYNNLTFKNKISRVMIKRKVLSGITGDIKAVTCKPNFFKGVSIYEVNGFLKKILYIKAMWNITSHFLQGW